MSDKQMIFVCLEQTMREEKLFESLKEDASKKVKVVDRSDEGLTCDSITFIQAEDNILTPEEPLWVGQQQNKKLWRKK